MLARHRTGSARLIFAGLGMVSLLGVLVAVAIMATMSAEQAETAVETRKHAEEQVEDIQKRLNLRGEQAERMMEQMQDGADESEEPTTAPADED